ELPAMMQNQVVEASKLPEGLFVQSQPAFDLNRRTVTVAWLGPDAAPKVVEVPLAPRTDQSVDWSDMGVVLPNPAVLTAGWIVASQEMVENGRLPTVDGALDLALAESWPRFWPALAIVGVVSIVLAAATWRRQRRYALGNELVWTGFVAIF